MAPGTFAEPPRDDPPKPAAGDGEPATSGTASITVQTAEVLLKSRPKAVPASASAAAPADDTGATSSQYRPQATARLEEHASGYVKAYWMEEHLPEYQYTMVTNADGDDVPGILFDGTAYELELLSASDVETIASQTRVDKKFSDFATRVNKVCSGGWILRQGTHGQGPLDRLGGFCQSLPQGSSPQTFSSPSQTFLVPQ